MASDPDFTPHLTVAAVIERDGTFLCVEERAGGERVINQPAGHVDDGESLLDAVCRETLEETGWAFRPTALVAIYRWRHPDNGETFIRATFRGELGDHLHERPPDDGIIEAVWLTHTQLRNGVNLRSPLVLRSVEDYLAGNRFPLEILVDI